ncbi:MAG: tetratricopeptide repeat protein [Phycisphaerae bacterium]|nr:tetratricopeptide repeat protein [Phycisphaerae bacterium]
MDDATLAKLREELLAAPDDPHVHLRIAEYLYGQGGYEDAAAAARRALQLGHDWPEARLLLGKAWMGQGCPSEASFQFKQILDRYPDHEEAAAHYESLRRTTAAIEVIRRSNPPDLQLYVRNHVIVLRFSGMMAPYSEDGDYREPFDRLTTAIARLLTLGQIGCVVDLSRVHFVTSFFLSKLLEWRRKLFGDMRGLVICGARPEIRDLLTSTRVSRLMRIVDSLDDAMRIVRDVAEKNGR